MAHWSLTFPATRIPSNLCSHLYIYNLALSLLSVEEEFCQWETFNATCGEGEVIVMRTARYGRMKLGKCLTTDYFVGCSADVLSHVDTRLAFLYTISKESKTRKTFSNL